MCHRKIRSLRGSALASNLCVSARHEKDANPTHLIQIIFTATLSARPHVSVVLTDFIYSGKYVSIGCVVLADQLAVTDQLQSKSQLPITCGVEPTGSDRALPNGVIAARRDGDCTADNPGNYGRGDRFGDDAAGGSRFKHGTAGDGGDDEHRR